MRAKLIWVLNFLFYVPVIMGAILGLYLAVKFNVWIFTYNEMIAGFLHLDPESTIIEMIILVLQIFIVFGLFAVGAFISDNLDTWSNRLYESSKREENWAEKNPPRESKLQNKNEGRADGAS